MPTNDRLLFSVDGLASELRVARFAGWEELGGLFRFDVLVVAEDAAVAFDDVVGKPATLTIVGEEDGESRFVRGIVAELEAGEVGKKLTSYRATLVPKLHPLTLGQEIRIFQELAAPDIIQKVLEGAGLAAGDDFRLALQGSYVVREYCVQYRESNWTFIRRLMEEEGIFCHFEHAEDKAVLVVADKSTSTAAIAGESTIAYRPPLGAMAVGEHVSRFTCAQGIQPGKVTLRDYLFKKPTLLLEGEAEAGATPDIEFYDYPGDFAAPAEGSALAKLRLERWQGARKRATGDSSCARLVPGLKFTLSEHPRDALNTDWLLVRLEHRGFEPNIGDAGSEGEPRYENRFECMPADVPFRPALVTPRPSIRGLQTGFVVGPAGEEIHTDEHGRVRVHFHWDRVGKRDDKSSCWIRVAQMWAGPAYGGMFIPRVGHEVVIDFLEGDPDRPIVVGCVYHGTNVPPYGLPSDKTKSTIKTSSSPGGAGFNELRFEDKKGAEEIFLHGQKDWNIVIEHDKTQTIGHDETLDVGNDRTKHVAHDQTETVDHDNTITVGNNHTESIGKAEAITVGTDASRDVGGAMALTVGKGSTEEIGEALSVSVGKDHTLTVGGKQAVGVTGDQNEAFDANKTTEVKGTFSLTVVKDLAVEVEGDRSDKVGKKQTVVVGDKLTVECGSAKVTIAKNGDVSVEGKNITVKGSGPVKIQGSKVDVKSDGAVNVEASGNVKIKGSAVGLN